MESLATMNTKIVRYAARQLIAPIHNHHQSTQPAFSMQYANQHWQADTMFGPRVGGRQKIDLRYERHRNGAVIDYDKGRRLGQARLLDAVANGLARRK
jgi:hypothetical protein